MLVTEFKLPELGENIDQGDLVRLMISPVASVAEGQPVMELETDKAVVEVPSSVAGTVKEIRVKEGDKVKVGQVIFTVENGAGGKIKSATEPKAQAMKAPAEKQSPPVQQAVPPSKTEAQAAAVSSAPAISAAVGATEFTLPELGENIDQGDLVRLMISPGAKVSEGQPVMELETDKAVVEVPSSVTGTVKDVRVKEGEKVKVGQLIFTLENGTGAKARAPETKGPESKAPATAIPEERPASAPATQPQVERRKTPPPPPYAAATEFRLPELGENIEAADLVRLMISPGTKVSEGQPIMELETDKAVVEVPSSVSGVVKEVRVKQGEKVKVGQVIFTLEGGITLQPQPVKHAPVEHVSGQHGARLAFQAAIKAEGKTEEQALPVDQPRLTTPDFTMPAQLGKVAGTEYREPVPAAPHVRRLARELGLDIQAVKGTGPGGRINDDDVKAHSKALLTSVSEAAQAPRTHVVEPELPDFSKWGKVERVSMRGVRRKTAEHLWEAWSTIPHVTQHDKA